jgi:hypothetical protein
MNMSMLLYYLHLRLLVSIDHCGLCRFSPWHRRPRPASPPESRLNINCIVFGDDPSRVFQVKIANDESVSALKKAIKDEKKPAFEDVAADTLKLWKVGSLNWR